MKASRQAEQSKTKSPELVQLPAVSEWRLERQKELAEIKERIAKLVPKDQETLKALLGDRLDLLQFTMLVPDHLSFSEDRITCLRGPAIHYAYMNVNRALGGKHDATSHRKTTDKLFKLLDKLDGLESLAVSGTSPANLEFVKDKANLKQLQLPGYRVRSLKGLEGAPLLESLGLEKSPIKGTAWLALQVHSQMKFLGLSGNKGLNDWTFAAAMRGLVSIDLDGTGIRNLEPARVLPMLEEFSANSTLISDASPLAQCKKLKKLCLSGTQVTDATVVKNLKQLGIAMFASTGISDLKALKGHKAIWQINFGGTKVSSIEELSTCPKLYIAHLWGLTLDSLKPLLACKRLGEVNLEDSKIKFEAFEVSIRALANQPIAQLKTEHPEWSKEAAKFFAEQKAVISELLKRKVYVRTSPGL